MMPYSILENQIVLWNTVTFSDDLADDLWQGWVHHSYERVVAGLPKAKRPQAPQR